MSLFSGPEGSYFSFSADFYQLPNTTLGVVVGAPRANSSQPGVIEGGAVFFCPWSSSGGACDVLNFDLKGDETFRTPNLQQKTSKSHQWLGASVRSLQDHILACAPLFHWNVKTERGESENTPVGTCLLLNVQTGQSLHYSPCRDNLVEADYKARKYINDRRYCEAGFSSDVTKDDRVVIGAPGGYYFQGQVISAALRDIIDSAKTSTPVRFVPGETVSPETGGYDRYHGYSVATGELTGDTLTDYVVGVPNDRDTSGSVKIYDGDSSRILLVHHTFPGTQVASYFGHSVAVTDINNDGLEDVLVGAPLFMERVSGQHLQEVGQVSVFLQRGYPSFLSRPDQVLGGTDVYGRFGSSLAALGDLDMDGYNDVAVGAPSAGGEGKVFIYLGRREGLSPQPSQVLPSPHPQGTRPAAFGFTLRGGTDIDANGYPDLIVGAWGVDTMAVYRAQAVIIARTELSLLPDFLNPDVKQCELPSSNKPVACFIVEMCVHVSGHRIPLETVLEAELQLDKMKQPMARRTLLMQTNQPQEHFQLTIKRDVGVVCRNYTAYLRPESEFKDKLSPIFISLNYSLLDSQQAVLHGQKSVVAQTRIILDCGEDNMCVPDLQLIAEAGTESLVVGDDHPALVMVTAENRGEGAYETEMEIRPPPNTHYQSVLPVREDLSRLVCVQRKENQTVLIVCELGNPMKQGQKLQAGLLFSVSHLEDVENHVTFKLQIKSKNSQSPDSNVVNLRIGVIAMATLEMRGGSSPLECVLPVTSWQQSEQPHSLEDVGPLVEHVYELRNLGPSTVNARLEVNFPTRQDDKYLLYVFANASEELLSCHSNSSDIDPYRLASNVTERAMESFQQHPETHQHEPPQRGTILVNCSGGEGCVRFVCEATGLQRGWSSVVRISARLWLHTFTQRPYVNFDLRSSAKYEVTSTASKIQPQDLSSGHAETKTSVLWRSPDGEKEVPVWWIVVSIISGLLLLALLCFIFWKVGFFKRSRPPSDDDDDDEEELAAESEYAQMPTDTHK
ncbi:integrin alpha-IIb [Osmerus eperlanus]|uniref:integrin alpha-IIb n=1 Tax=Osmerus eperlanus TaxID=29151 RepID=UPI002E155499